MDISDYRAKQAELVREMMIHTGKCVNCIEGMDCPDLYEQCRVYDEIMRYIPIETYIRY